MEEQLLKEKILHAIKKRKVQFALFYTFNFEPVFFENYVLPLLMPDPEKFTDSVIANQILWREYRKSDEIPNITVYCDDFAKSTTHAPTLEYNMRCIRVPCASGAVTNFHLKHIFLILEDETLLFINGSGNLTPAGWCRNVESFSIETFNPKTQKPLLEENSLSKLVASVAKLFTGEMTEAERKIQLLLKQWSFTHFKYFNSFESDFKSFIKNNILTSRDTIQVVEIISPYFSPTDKFIQFILHEVVHHSSEWQKIRFLLPMRQDEINLEKETFNKLSTSSWVTWHEWLQNSLNERYTHAKIYNFIGKKTTFTIIGSVNFTEPAWRQYEKQGNQANIEAAILYEHKTKDAMLLDKNPIDTRGMRFLLKPDAECNTAEQNSFISRNAPNIIFTIDWQARTLRYEFPLFSYQRGFGTHKWEGIFLNRQTYLIFLNKEQLKKLAKNSLIEVTENLDGTVITYFYYPNHINFAQKPLTTRLSSDEILYYWNHLDDKLTVAQSLMHHLSDMTDEETGEIETEKTPSLLNQWALTFNGLCKLETHLFGKKIDNQTITYYLTHKSYDTILTYLDELEDNYNNEKIKLHKTFYWTILQIIKQNFYEHSCVKVFANASIGEIVYDLQQKIQKVESELPDFKSNQKKYHFLKQQIKYTYSNGTV